MIIVRTSGRCVSTLSTDQAAPCIGLGQRSKGWPAEQASVQAIFFAKKGRNPTW